jgi:thiamine-monophosphate kinase
MALTARSQGSSRIREFDLIRALKRRYAKGSPKIVRGIGDDAAVIIPKASRPLLLTTDLLAEGVHFDRDTAAFADIGFRAAAANLSDIAAMGGTPEYLLVSLAIPRHGTARQVEQLYDGMMAACRSHEAKLIGGDTSASHGGWFVNITVVGSTTLGRTLFRDGAEVGDDLYVTGTLGDSEAGLQLLHRGHGTGTGLIAPRHRRFLIGRHLRPPARIREGRWLSNGRWASSAIDVSDGLSGDLRHLCAESDVGAVIELEALPISSACRHYAERTKQNAQVLALGGGEDYELLFTVPVRKRARFQRASAQQRLQVTKIGRITPVEEGLCMTLADGQQRPLPFSSYEHFRSRQ